MSEKTSNTNNDSLKLAASAGRRKTDLQGVQTMHDLELINYQGKHGLFAPLVNEESSAINDKSIEQVILAMKEQMSLLQLENQQLKSKIDQTNLIRKRTPDDFSTAISHSVDSLQSRLNDMKNPVSRFAIKEFEVEFNVFAEVSEMGTIDYRFIAPEEDVSPDKLSKIRMSLVPLPKESEAGSWSSPHFTPMRDVEEIQGIGERYQKLLNKNRIYTISDLITSATRSRSKIELSKMLGVDRERLGHWLSHAELLTIKTMDGRSAEVLANIGVVNLEKLAQQRVDALVAAYNQEVERLGHAVLRPLEPEKAENWIAVAQAFAGQEG